MFIGCGLFKKNNNINTTTTTAANNNNKNIYPEMRQTYTPTWLLWSHILISC